MSDKINFSLDGPRYDQSTFYGRLKGFFESTNPINLFRSDKQVEKYQEILEQYKNGTLPENVSENDLWNARYTITTQFSRDGKKIPIPFRTNGYALTNLPICVGLMYPGLGIPTTVFWQWANQTQNALFNHHNRSGDKEVDQNNVIKSYLFAVSTAVGISVGSTLGLKKMKGNLKNILGKFVPFASVGTANVVNTYLMRRHELTEGINVLNEKKEVVGISRIAAAEALKKTCASRLFMSFSLLIVPPFLYPIFQRTKLLRTFPKLNTPMQATIVGGMMFLVVPTMLALFEEEVAVTSDKLEPEFHQKYPGSKLYFNKGL